MANINGILYQFSSPTETFRNIVNSFPKAFIFLTKPIGGSIVNTENIYITVVKAFGPIAYWQLIEDSSAFYDLSGNNLSIALSKPAKRMSGPFKGEEYACELKDDVYLECSSNQAGQIGSEFTYEAWIKRTSFAKKKSSCHDRIKSFNYKFDFCSYLVP